MTRKEQRTFVRELVRDVESDLLNKLSRVPEDWDGIELRWWVAEIYSRIVVSDTGLKQRRSEYKNSVIVNNLT